MLIPPIGGWIFPAKNQLGFKRQFIKYCLYSVMQSHLQRGIEEGRQSAALFMAKKTLVAGYLFSTELNSPSGVKSGQKGLGSFH